MSRTTKVRMIFTFILVSVCSIYIYTSLSSSTTPAVHGEEVKLQYYEILDHVEGLYSNHSQLEGKYYNEEFSDKDEIKNYLSEYMTEKASYKVIDELFKEEDRALYNESLQEYLKERDPVLRSGEGETSFYSTVKQTIINPGLKFVFEEDIQVEISNNEVVLEVTDAPVYFYDHADVNTNNYERYGYPSEDKISVKFSFVEKDGQLLLDDYKIKTENVTS
ncbi:hypothetical protein [Evansella halocellulosilytica]|uniref:hypothetical protein n=1 Tax=Evansella halocellulosilytica TaxID=2011013 RepID=UPI0011557B7C|nr:hypothetical protein [Evansella halocellulosilytica]